MPNVAGLSRRSIPGSAAAMITPPAVALECRLGGRCSMQDDYEGRACKW